MSKKYTENHSSIDDGDIGFVTVEKYNHMKQERDKYRKALETITDSCSLEDSLVIANRTIDKVDRALNFEQKIKEEEEQEEISNNGQFGVGA